MLSAVEANILAAFFERVSKAEEVSDDVVIGLRRAFASGKLPKPEQLVQLIADNNGELLT